MENKYKAWLTEITNNNQQEFQLRIDFTEGYFILRINPETKEVKLIKDKTN
jgi:hypothetical protein